jgi:hypothetical protein
MKFQGRGKVYLQERLANGNLGPGVEICPDTYVVALATETFTHLNKCGPVDVVDASGVKSTSATVNFSFSDVEDAKFAIAALGTVNPTATGTNTDEVVVDSATAGSFAFIGGKNRRRGITGLTLEDHSTSPATELTADTDYTLDAASGKVTFLTDVDGPVFASTYTYADPASVSLLTSGQKEYFASFENINKQNANDPGSFEIYRLRPQPVKSIDEMSDELQILELDADALADPDRDFDDTLFGPFGRRVL